jgi:hypothetical protein
MASAKMLSLLWLDGNGSGKKKEEKKNVFKKKKWLLF